MDHDFDLYSPLVEAPPPLATRTITVVMDLVPVNVSGL